MTVTACVSLCLCMFVNECGRKYQNQSHLKCTTFILTIVWLRTKFEKRKKMEWLLFEKIDHALFSANLANSSHYNPLLSKKILSNSSFKMTTKDQKKSVGERNLLKKTPRWTNTFVNMIETISSQYETQFPNLHAHEPPDFGRYSLWRIQIVPSKQLEQFKTQVSSGK